VQAFEAGSTGPHYDARMDLERDLDLLVTPGLGDASYLLASGDEALVVDPQRDIGRVLASAEARGVHVRIVLETHVHNDYVSGAAEISAATGARILGPAGAGYAFPFDPMEEGAELRLGALRLVALRTPGHTPEHTSYAVQRDGDGILAVFSGGSLIVGSAGRTDLLGDDRTEELARAQYRSMRRFAEMPGGTLVLPTHGAGSFCASGPPQEDRTSTIDREQASNPALRAPDEETFVREQLAGLLAFPTYYAHMAPINRAGPPVVGGVPTPPRIGPEELERAVAAGARVVDARPGDAFARAHVPGSLNVPLEDSFASYVGWLVPFGTPLVLIVADGDALRETTTQLFRIGYEVPGALDGGIEAWSASGRPVSSYPVASVAELIEETRAGGGRILDVRQRTEWDAGHLSGSRHCFVGDVPARLDELTAAGDTVVACASGHRSAMAASLLHAAGVNVRLVARGGVGSALRRMG
jgi:glyoxylase-like metal-dependent hydrolase (beta-lactamase superfamily II)/rhodanese-related sulfurtransferase